MLFTFDGINPITVAPMSTLTLLNKYSMIITFLSQILLFSIEGNIAIDVGIKLKPGLVDIIIL